MTKIGHRKVLGLNSEGGGAENNHVFFSVASDTLAGICDLFLMPRKKNVVLPSATDQSPKIKLKHWDRECAQFLLDWVFFHFFEKKGGKCTQIWCFGCLKNIIEKKNRPTDPNTPLEGNTTTFFFGD